MLDKIALKIMLLIIGICMFAFAVGFWLAVVCAVVLLWFVELFRG